MSLNTILLDPSIYHDPYTFHPERWLSGTPTELKKLNNYLVPFGRGARMCVGQKYALPLSPITPPPHLSVQLLPLITLNVKNMHLY